MNKNLLDRNSKTDIVLKLKPREGSATSVTGLVDRRLFTGENNLHAIMDIQTCLWHLAYDNGVLPSALKQQWTGFTKLYKDVQLYMDKRNIDIVDVVD